MLRVGAIKRDAQAQGQISFEESGVVANKMGAVLVQNSGFDALEETWSLEQFQAERTGGIIIGREQRKPALGVTRNNAGKKIEIIFDYAGVNRLGSYIDHPRARLRQKQKKKKEPFFVTLRFETCRCHLDRHRGNDHDRLLLLIEGLD